MAKNKYPSMSMIEPLKHPFTNIVYDPEMYENCVQIQLNKDGSTDVYDYNTTKHLMRI